MNDVTVACFKDKFNAAKLHCCWLNAFVDTVDISLSVLILFQNYLFFCVGKGLFDESYVDHIFTKHEYKVTIFCHTINKK